MGDVLSEEDEWHWLARFGPRGNLREAVAVFDKEEDLQEAVDDLECHGFSNAAISRPATLENLTISDRRHPVQMSDIEDDANIPRDAYIDPDSRETGIMIVVVIPVYISLLIAIGISAANNFSTFELILLAAALGLIGGAGGYYFSRGIARRSKDRLEAERALGGLLLWVRTGSVKQDKKAVKILKDHGGRHVHLHGPKHT